MAGPQQLDTEPLLPIMLAWVSQLLLIIGFFAIAQAAVFEPGRFLGYLFVLPVLGCFLVAFPLLAYASRKLHVIDLVWEKPLQAFIVATVLMGFLGLMDGVFKPGYSLFGGLGIRAAISILVGGGVNQVVRFLQARFDRRKDT